MNRSSTPSNGVGLLLLLAGASGCSSILEGSPFEQPEGVSGPVVSAGTAHTCSVIEGSVGCWGSDEYDGIVFGVVSEPPEGSSFLGIASGAWYSCALEVTGEVTCWGNDTDGQVSTTPERSFASIEGGSFHVCGVTTSGSVECWGANSDGQSSPPSGSFESVSAGAYHTCGVTSSGSIECWGRDEDGESSPP